MTAVCAIFVKCGNEVGLRPQLCDIGGFGALRAIDKGSDTHAFILRITDPQLMRLASHGLGKGIRFVQTCAIVMNPGKPW